MVRTSEYPTCVCMNVWVCECLNDCEGVDIECEVEGAGVDITSCLPVVCKDEDMRM